MALNSQQQHANSCPLHSPEKQTPKWSPGGAFRCRDSALKRLYTETKRYQFNLTEFVWAVTLVIDFPSSPGTGSGVSIPRNQTHPEHLRDSHALSSSNHFQPQGPPPLNSVCSASQEISLPIPYSGFTRAQVDLNTPWQEFCNLHIDKALPDLENTSWGIYWPLLSQFIQHSERLRLTQGVPEICRKLSAHW